MSTILSSTELQEAKRRSDDFWHRQFPRAIRQACESPDGTRIAMRVTSKAFGRPEQGGAYEVLSWIACVEREIDRQRAVRQ
jgi:hypothetical protein